MLVTFDTLPDQSKIWVYQAERALTDEEQQIILQIGEEFMGQWSSHGVALSASIQILLGRFVMIAVNDQHLPSGCSIDASVGLMRDLGKRLNLDFFERNQIPLWIDEKVVTVPLAGLKSQLKQGKISRDTQLVNTLIAKKGDLSNWIIPIKDSWLSRYLPQAMDNYQ